MYKSLLTNTRDTAMMISFADQTMKIKLAIEHVTGSCKGIRVLNVPRHLEFAPSNAM